MARLGAQVVAGIGFIGAGTIVVTRQHRVKGLTTAAGLWASAIIGLALGGGFYEGALLTTVLVLVAESFLSRLEYRILDHVPEINLYMEYADKSSLEEVLRLSGKTGSLCRTWRSPALPAAKTTTPAPFSPCGSARRLRGRSADPGHPD